MQGSDYNKVASCGIYLSKERVKYIRRLKALALLVVLALEVPVELKDCQNLVPEGVIL